MLKFAFPAGFQPIAKPLGNGVKSGHKRQDKALIQRRECHLPQLLMPRALLRDNAALPEIGKTALRVLTLRPGIAALPQPAIAQKPAHMIIGQHRKPQGRSRAPMLIARRKHRPGFCRKPRRA